LCPARRKAVGIIDALLGAAAAVLTMKSVENASPELQGVARSHAREIGVGVKAVGKLAVTGGRMAANAVHRNISWGDRMTPAEPEESRESQDSRVNEAVLAALEDAQKKKKEKYGKTNVIISG